jgi:hypothetical protein
MRYIFRKEMDAMECGGVGSWISSKYIITRWLLLLNCPPSLLNLILALNILGS